MAPKKLISYYCYYHLQSLLYREVCEVLKRIFHGLNTHAATADDDDDDDGCCFFDFLYTIVNCKAVD